MRLNDVDLNLFVVFDAIYSERNLTRAAEVLHVTQPAVSNALRRLRTTFSDPLFVRSPQGMLPTPMAENVIGRVREALQMLDNSLLEHDRFAASSSEKVFRVSMGDMAEALYLPALLQRLEVQAPQVSVQSFPLARENVPLELANGGADFAVEPPLLSDPQLCSSPLLKDEYVCVLRPAHPACASPLSLTDYLALQHIHISSRRRGLGHVDLALQALGKKRQLALRAQHYMVATLIVARTDLALSMPRGLAAQSGLAIRPLPFDVEPLSLNLYWHKSADNDPASCWFRETFANTSVPPEATGGRDREAG